MLILPWKELFVVIVETWDPVDLGGGTSLKRFSTGTNALLRQLGAHSPFRSKIYKDRGCAFAFEVHFDCITGMDYMNHLIQPGRFVLEAKDVRKREFLSVSIYIHRFWVLRVLSIWEHSLRYHKCSIQYIYGTLFRVFFNTNIDSNSRRVIFLCAVEGRLRLLQWVTRHGGHPRQHISVIW